MPKVAHAVSVSYDLNHGIQILDTTGDLPARAAHLWEVIAPDARDISREYWLRFQRSPEVTTKLSDAEIDQRTERGLGYMQAKFTDIANPDAWASLTAKIIADTFEQGLTLTTVLACISAGTERAFVAIRKYCTDTEQALLLARTLSEIQNLEVDAHVFHATSYVRHQGEQLQRRQAEVFNNKVLGVVNDVTLDSDQLRNQSAKTAASARGMLGKTSEVAAAAEQSAVAMREAAQTAAGLIRAIEDARAEVETAADVATRAGSQASDAVKVSQALSSHVEAIESILGLIRDIAGQTNLLGLECNHRSSARGRCRTRVCSGRAGSEEPGQPDRPGNR